VSEQRLQRYRIIPDDKLFTAGFRLNLTVLGHMKIGITIGTVEIASRQSQKNLTTPHQRPFPLNRGK
jgi:hypothetical protein